MNQPETPDTGRAAVDVEPIYRRVFVRFVRDLRAAFGNGPPDPEDVAQTAFEKVLSHRSPTEIRDLEGYLWRIAQNYIVSELRSQNSAAARELAYADSFIGRDGYLLTPERVLASRDQLTLALKTLGAMPDHRRRAFELVRLEGMSHSEAASLLGVSRPAVTKHVTRATADLYSALADAQGNPAEGGE
ncbi:MAG: sigma-70 family RNA polymerase sigma factor [Pseudomonadota bacterium]